TSKIVIALQQRPRDFRVPAIAAGDALDLNLTQLLQTAAHLRNFNIDLRFALTLKPIRTAAVRQCQYFPAIQLGQSFAATHLLQPAARRTPIQPLAHLSRQLAPRLRRFAVRCGLNPRYYFTAKLPAAYDHRRYYAKGPPTVSSVYTGQPLEEGCLSHRVIVRRRGLGG